MKDVKTALLATALVTWGVGTAQAQNWGLFGNYTDTLVSYHVDGGGTATAQVNPNTFNNAAGTPLPPNSIYAYASDGDAAANNGYRLLETSGGGADRAYGADLYFISSDGYGSPDGFTRITGLSANTLYTVALYGVIGGNKDTLSVSLDGGTSWSSTIDEAVINAHLFSGSDWLEHSTVDAIGTPMAARDGDTRFRTIIGTATSDGGGTLIVGFRDPNVRSTGGASDRGRIDGFAVAVGGVPEPTAFALAGLGGLTLWMVRRRRGD